MKSYFGLYFISLNSEPSECSVLVFDKKISVGYRNSDGSSSTVQWWMNDVEVSLDLNSQTTKVVNKNHPGIELVIQGNDAARYVVEMKEEMEKPWYQKSGAREWGRNLLLMVGIAGILFLLYLLIVPWLSEKMASRISAQTEAKIGEAVYNAMGISANEDAAKSRVLNEFFIAMDVPSVYNTRISVVNDNVVNAFALPGGRIVVYRALLERVSTYPELAALLSHEFTHINNKHSTRSIFRRFGSKVFIALLFGKFGSVTSVLIDHADNLKSLKYSRKLEKEADTEGLQLLLQRKIDPNGFVELFRHLKEASSAGNIPEFLASHPDIDKRIEYIKESSKNAPVEENSKLQAIFEKLK